MTSQGPLYAGNAINDDSAGTLAWDFASAAEGSPDNISAEAVTGIFSSAKTHYLAASGYGFSVPEHASITGVEAAIRQEKSGVGSVVDEEVKLIVGGVVAGDDRADPDEWPGSMADRIYGSASDLWGLSLDRDDVNSADFGIAIRADVAAQEEARIDAVSLTVHYELPPFFVARNAAWDAVDNWADFSGVFNHKYKFDGDSGPEIAPHADQLPAIELYPTAVESTQFTHRQHDDSLTLEFLVYTKTWDPVQAETIAKDLRKALWQSKPGSGATYIQAATGSHPQPNLNITFERGYLPGNQKATLTRFQFTLKLKHDPLD